MGFEPPLAYLYLPDGVDPGEFNPIYSTTYVVRVNQPVLRGAGRAVALAPIQIAGTQANQSRWALEDVLNSQIRSITEGYWRLYAAHLIHTVSSLDAFFHRGGPRVLIELNKRLAASFTALANGHHAGNNEFDDLSREVTI